MAAMASTPALLGSIRLAGKKRKVWQSFPASQRSSKRLLAAAEDDGHGGVLVVCEVTHRREREGELEREGKEEGGLCGVQQRLQRGSPHHQDKQEVALGNLQGLHAAAYHPKEEDRNILQKAP
jgi:hypothetical protein